MINGAVQNGRTVVQALNDCKEDLKEFISTRLQILRSEMTGKVAGIKRSLPALLAGAMLLLGAFFLFTWGLVAFFAMFMLGRPYAYVVAFFLVAILYALIGGIAVALGMKNLASNGLKPTRTMRVLQDDQIWLQSEVKTQI